MRAREIFLLIFIICAGIFFFHAQTGKLDWDIDWGINWGEDFLFNVDEYAYEDSLEIEPPYPPELQVLNTHGSINVQGTEGGKITLTLRKRIWRRNEEKARKVSDELQMVVDKTESALVISTNRDEFRKKNFKTEFKISVPAGMVVSIRNSYGIVKTSNTGKTQITNPHGEIKVFGVDGDLVIQNSYEDIEAENIRLNCQIEGKHADVFVQGVGGSAQLRHPYGKISLKDIQKDVTVEGSHTEVIGQKISGSTDIETSYEKIALFDVGAVTLTTRHSGLEINRSAGNIEISNRYGSVKLNDIQGNISIFGKNIGIAGKSLVGEKIDISSSYGDIELNGFTGKTTVDLSHGDITLKPHPLNFPIEIKGKYADILFEWPEGKYPVEARSKSGDIQWKLEAPLSFKEDNSLTVIKAFTEEKNRPPIFLSTTYGTIKIVESPK